MKQFSFIFLAFLSLLVSLSVKGQWSQLGNAGFSAGSIIYPSITVDKNGTPYIVYRDEGNSSKATVMKYNGSNWVTVGNAGFSLYQANYTSIAIDATGIIYVAYSDGLSSNRATVMKYNGSNWSVVGSIGFTPNLASYTSIAVDAGGIPHIAYGDDNSSGKATVMKFDGTNWVTVGSAGFSAGQASFISLKFDANNTPYIGYQDGGSNFKATVMKYNGTNWVNVGNAGLSAGPVNYASLALHPDGTPYIGYQDISNGIKATVKKFDGSNWVGVGSKGFSADTVYFTSLAIDSKGIPYITYVDVASNHRATVMKYRNNNWTVVGTPGFSMSLSNFPVIAIYNNCTLFVGYGDSAANYKASAMSFNLPLEDKASICAVLTDTISGNNIVVWESLNSFVDSYKIYREDNGSYVHIGTVASSINQFIDVTATPQLQSYNYKLILLDSCARESVPDSASAHKSIKLRFNSLQNGMASISWNSYEGRNNLTYTVKRSNNGGVFTGIASFIISGSDTTYIDNSIPSGTNVYRIDVALATACIAGSVNYDKITSNIATAWNTGIEKINSSQKILLIPNPANRFVKISAAENISKLEINSIIGQKVISKKGNEQKEIIIDVSDLLPGTYLIKVNDISNVPFIKH